MQVKLREKKLKNGDKSLYLDVYANGKRNYEFLDLRLKKVRNQIDRDLNKETMIAAENTRAKRQIELQSSAHGIISTAKKKIGVLAYFEAQREKRKITNIDQSAWQSALKHLKLFVGKKDIPLSQVDEIWIEKFRDYLLFEAKKSSGDKLTQNSAHHYFNRFKNCFKMAYKEKLISDNPADRVDYIEQTEVKREFLTFEELQLLVKTDCRYPILKTAFLFSALTGLRWSDIQQLVWSEVQYSEQNGWKVHFRQKKTDGVENLPINDNARSLLGDRGESEERVFKGLKYSAYSNVALAQWCLAAGISKRITFHCARHTAATLLITSGVDIYTVSKLLGHKDIKITQLYAKLIDQKKIEAVNKIPQLQL
jgi:integrase